jgi:tRNA A-37 threonylcarbamoyl transferase component Bud32
MSFIELLDDPERFRIGDNYKASNVVFPVEFKGEKYIIKKPRNFSNIINRYYTFQDRFFLQTMEAAPPRARMNQEATKLLQIDGFCAPRLVDFAGETLVKEYLPGVDFRNLASDEQELILKCGLDLMVELHARGITIGSSEVKNLLKGKERVYWLDFDGMYHDSGHTGSVAQDFIRFVYSTYLTTRNAELTLDVARNVAWINQSTETRWTVADLLGSIKPGLGLRFVARMPDTLHNKIKRILQ